MGAWPRPRSAPAPAVAPVALVRSFGRGDRRTGSGAPRRTATRARPPRGRGPTRRAAASRSSDPRGTSRHAWPAPRTPSVGQRASRTPTTSRLTASVRSTTRSADGEEAACVRLVLLRAARRRPRFPGEGQDGERGQARARRRATRPVEVRRQRRGQPDAGEGDDQDQEEPQPIEDVAALHRRPAEDKPAYSTSAKDRMLDPAATATCCRPSNV